MTKYNPVERKIAGFLNRYPAIKRETKRVYQRVNYRIFGEDEFTHEMNSDTELFAVSEWFGSPSQKRKQFFGYFDTTPWSDAMKAGLYHEYSGSDTVDLVEYRDGTRRVVGSSSAWNFQQGSRAQWHPTQNNCILYNDIESDRTFAKQTTTTGEIVETFSQPIQAVNPTGGDYLSLNYRRLDRHRPDYGYGTDDGTLLQPPEADGLRLVDFETKEEKLVISLRSLIDATDRTAIEDKHYVNHALFDPTGDKFVFMHRWQDESGRISRLYLSDRAGNREILLDDDIVSHYCWLNKNQLFVWGRSEQFGDGYHIINVDTGSLKYVDTLDDWGDGHPSVSPDGHYVVTDTYPDRARKRHLLLYNRRADTVTKLGQFFEPLEYTGTSRCDLHPRWSPDGTAISIDSAHDGTRRSYIIDVTNIVDC